MRKTKGENNGITLIALVITIIVLLILAGVSIATLMGENGILTQASRAKEKTEIANIKEQADLVKTGLNIDSLSKRNNAERLKKSVLLSELNDYFEGSTLSGNRITTKDRKYDIIVRNNLDIFVVKRGDDYLKDGEIEISYYYNEEEIEDSLWVELYFEVAGYKSYHDYAEEILENSTEEQIIDMFVKGNNFLNEVFDYGEPIYNNIDELMKYWSETYSPDDPFTTIEGMCELYGYDNLAEFALDWGCVNPKEYGEKYNYKPYELYVKEILNSIEETGEARETILEQYFIEAQKYFGNTSEEGMEVTDFEEYMKNDYGDFGFTEGEEPTTLDELRIWMNQEWSYSYETIEEMLIVEKAIKPEEYFEKYGEKSLEVSISNGETFNVYYDAFYGELYGQFEVRKNGTYKITAVGPNGEKGEITIEIYLGPAEIKVGDYIDYKPDTITEEYSKTKLSQAITGSSNNTSDITQEDLDWQILKIYEDGSMDIIGSPTTQTVWFNDAEGYNNGVYVLNDICKTLYSRGNIKARSVNIEDFESNLTEVGKNEKDTYISEKISRLDTSNICITNIDKANNTVTSEISSSHYPNIYAQENGAGINTSIVKKDGIKPSEMLKDEDGNPVYDTNTGTSAYKHASTRGLTVMQTYYSLEVNSKNYGEAYKALISNDANWIASRCVRIPGDALFGLCYFNKSFFGTELFSSYSGKMLGSGGLIRPVVHLDKEVKIEPFAGINSKTNTHTITQY